MFRKLIHKFKGNTISGHHGKGTEERTLIPLGEAKSILLLLDHNDVTARKQCEVLVKDKALTTLIVHPLKAEEGDEYFGYCDLSMRGKQENKYIDQVLQGNYDLLLNLARSKTPLSSYLFTNASCKCKVAVTEMPGADVVFTISDQINLELQIDKIFKLLRDLKQY
ncbi:MAG: DUF6913 domain-containing protein [Marinifilaceae bacterium]